jgi:hypothetical protein
VHAELLQGATAATLATAATGVQGDRDAGANLVTRRPLPSDDYYARGGEDERSDMDDRDVRVAVATWATCRARTGKASLSSWSKVRFR